MTITTIIVMVIKSVLIIRIMIIAVISIERIGTTIICKCQ